MIIASLGTWLYLDYRNNQLMQTYLQRLQLGAGTWIGVIAGLGIASFVLEFLLSKDKRRRFQVVALYGAVLIATLSLFLYLDYRANAYLQVYLATHTLQLIVAFLGVAGVYGAIAALTKAGVTKRLLDKIRKDDILVFVGYILITIGFTYPVVLHMTDSVPQVSRDVWHVLWDLWWVNSSITSFHSPYLVNIILYPTGTNGVFHTWAFVDSLPGILLQPLFGLVTTLNLLFLTSYIFSGVNMYALSKYLTKDSTASFIAGLVYAFSCQHLIQSLAHLNIMTQQWLPLYGLFLIKLIKERRLRNGIYSGLALALVTFSDLHFLYMALLLTIALLAYIIWMGRDLILNRKFIERLGLMLVTFLGLSSPFILAALPMLSQGSFIQQGLNSVTKNSADITTYFVPARTSALYNLLAQAFSLPVSNFSSISNRYQFVGYTVLLLAVYALIRSWRKRWQSLAPFWAALAVVALVLSLGPSLIVSGDRTSVPLPYGFLYAYAFQVFPLTLLRSIRAVSRFSILVMMSLSVLVAFAVKDINGYLRRRQSQTRVAQFLGPSQAPRIRVDRAKVLSVFVIALILFEFWSAPLPVRDASIPTYYQIIQQDPNKLNAVMEVPIFLIGSSYLYYQTYHQHVIVNGKLARNPPYTVVFTETTPFVRTLQLKWPTRNVGPLVQSVNETQIAPYILGEYNIKYIVVHRTILDVNVSTGLPIPFPRAEQIIETLSGIIGPPVYDGTDATLFRFDNMSHLNLMSYMELNTTSTNSLMLLQGDWYGLGSLSSTASVNIFSAHITSVQLKLTLQSQEIQRVLQVQDGNDPPVLYVVPSGGNVTLVTNPITLRPGSNIVNFTSMQPCSVISLTNPTCVSFFFRSIETASPSSQTG